MKLSEAIRLGSMLKPQARGVLDTGRQTCALGAAMEAQPPELSYWMVTGPLNIKLARNVAFRGVLEMAQGQIQPIASFPSEWRDVTWTRRVCPECQTEDTINRLIPHLNDEHKWTRERIADWVESIERSIESQAPPSTVEVGVAAL